MEAEKLSQKLVKIQSELNIPKNSFNAFGKYKYRSCEDILQALKPLLLKYNVILVISDDIKMIGDRIYIEATSKIINGDNELDSISTKAFAREPEKQAGMSDAQVTGSASSYARKYSLSGIFAIDDNKCPDSQDNSDNKSAVGIDQIIKMRISNGEIAAEDQQPSEAQIKLLRSLAGKMNDSEKTALSKKFLLKSDCIDLIKKYKK